MDATAVYDVVADDFAAVNQTILDQLHSDVELVETISRYLVDAGGKRVRPLLVLLTAQACSYNGTQHTTLAAIIEFLHTATLLHDDVVDMSQLRRGRATANANWGNAPSVLVGDFLYSRAFQLMISLENVQILSILADATNVIAEGEVQQLMNRHQPDLSEAEYNAVINAKTAALFEASSHTGAILSGADSSQVEAMRLFGHHLGMAFQLIDDALDYEGNADEMGKNVGDDLAEGKATLPLIVTMQQAEAEQADMIRNAILAEAVDAEQIPVIVALVQQYGGLQYTHDQARHHADQALAQLTKLQESRYRDALANLVEMAVNRSK